MTPEIYKTLFRFLGERLIEYTFIDHKDDNHLCNLTFCSFGGIGGTIDDDLIHENDKVPSIDFENLRKRVRIH